MIKYNNHRHVNVIPQFVNTCIKSFPTKYYKVVMMANGISMYPFSSTNLIILLCIA